MKHRHKIIFLRNRGGIYCEWGKRRWFQRRRGGKGQVWRPHSITRPRGGGPVVWGLRANEWIQAWELARGRTCYKRHPDLGRQRLRASSNTGDSCLGSHFSGILSVHLGPNSLWRPTAGPQSGQLSSHSALPQAGVNCMDGKQKCQSEKGKELPFFIWPFSESS